VIRAVGFDLDDTLLDHRGAATNGIASLLHQQGWTYKGEHELGAEWAAIERVYFDQYRLGNLTMDEQRRERMRAILEMVNVDLREIEIKNLFAEYLKHYAKSWTAFPDALPILNELKGAGFRLAVLTNGQQQQQEAKLARIGMTDMFEKVLAIGSLSALKPECGAFMDLCSVFDAAPNEVVYVGDDVHRDAIAATEAGLHGVWLNREGESAPPGVKAEVRTLAPLLSAIDALNR